MNPFKFRREDRRTAPLIHSTVIITSTVSIIIELYFQRSSTGTVYFSEDMTDAENAIEAVLSDYDNLLKQLDENQKRAVVRTIGWYLKYQVDSNEENKIMW